MSLRSALLIAIFFAGPGFAAEPDCQAAFNLLRELGFPDVRGGRLVHTEESNRSRYYGSDKIDEVGGLPLATAWLMDAPSNAPAILFDLFGSRFRMISEDAGVSSNRDGTPDSDVVSGIITSLDARAYAVALTNFLGSIEAIESSNEEQAFFLASAFFLAAGLYQNGFQAEAIAITDRVLATHPDPESFLSACVNILADSAYEDSMTHFLADGNWAELAHRLKQIRQQFGRRWADGETVKAVEDAARRRAEQGADPLPAGEFPPWAVACLQEILSDKAIDTSALDDIRGYPWVLAPPLDPSVAQTQACPIVRLLDGGMASIPLLLAIATNPTPLRLSNRDPDRRFGSNERAKAVFERASRSGGERNVIFQSYSSGPFDRGSDSSASGLSRPMTLGELAMRLLLPLPTEKNYSREEDPLNAVRNWYEAHRNDTRNELALDRLNDDDNCAAYTAMRILLAEGCDSDRQHVERTILGMADKPDQAFSMAMYYVKDLSPTQAAAFKTNFVERIQKAMVRPATNDADPDLFVGESPDRSRSSQARMESMLKSFVKGGTAEEPTDLNAMLNSLGSTNTPLSSSALYTALQRTDREQAVVLITNAALRVSTPEQLGQLIWCLARLPDIEPADVEDPETGKAPAISPPWRPAAKPAAATAAMRVREKSALPKPLTLESLGPFWRQVLTDSRSNEWAKVRVQAAMIMEGLYGEKVENRMETRAILGECFDRLLIERNLERLDGGPFRLLPSLKDAAGTDRPGLEKTLLAIPVQELPAVVAMLGPVSVLALSTGAPVDPVLAARLGAIACRVESVPPGLGLQPGTRLATNDVARLVNTLKKTKEPGRITITIERKPQAQGIAIGRSASLPPSSDYNYLYSGRYEMSQMKESSPRAPLVYGKVEVIGREGKRFESAGASVFWFLEEEPEAGAGAKPVDLDARLDSRQSRRYSSEDNEERFWESVDRFCSATNLPLSPAAIRLYRIPPADWTTVGEPGGGHDIE